MPGQKRTLAHFTSNDANPFLGSSPFFGQGQNDGDAGAKDLAPLEGARIRGSPIVFLGLQEPDDGSAEALPSSQFNDAETAMSNVRGTPFFAMDVADFPQEAIELALKESSLVQSGAELSFSEPRAAMSDIDQVTAGVFASARSMVDWNTRNKVKLLIASNLEPG